MNRYRILADAAKELEQAAVYYEKASAGLGEEFIDEFERTIERVIEMPQAWTPLDADFRRCLFRRFPYALIYRVASNTVIVTSVFNQKRRPNSWRMNR